MTVNGYIAKEDDSTPWSDVERKRHIGGGRNYALPTFADRLLLVLVWTRLYLVFFSLWCL